MFSAGDVRSAGREIVTCQIHENPVDMMKMGWHILKKQVTPEEAAQLDQGKKLPPDVAGICKKFDPQTSRFAFYFFQEFLSPQMTQAIYNEELWDTHQGRLEQDGISMTAKQMLALLDNEDLGIGMSDFACKKGACPSQDINPPDGDVWKSVGRYVFIRSDEQKLRSMIETLKVTSINGLPTAKRKELIAHLEEVLEIHLENDKQQDDGQTFQAEQARINREWQAEQNKIQQAEMRDFQKEMQGLQLEAMETNMGTQLEASAAMMKAQMEEMKNMQWMFIGVLGGLTLVGILVQTHFARKSLEEIRKSRGENANVSGDSVKFEEMVKDTITLMREELRSSKTFAQPYIDSDRKVARMIDIVMRPQADQNNWLSAGQSRTGKTASYRGFAQAMALAELSDAERAEFYVKTTERMGPEEAELFKSSMEANVARIKGVLAEGNFSAIRMFECDINNLKAKGAVWSDKDVKILQEKLLDPIIAMADKGEKVILFVDEIQMGEDGNQQTGKVSLRDRIKKVAEGHPNITLALATTIQELSETIARDPASLNRYVTVFHEAASPEKVSNILKLKPYVKTDYGVMELDPAAMQATYLLGLKARVKPSALTSVESFFNDVLTQAQKDGVTHLTVKYVFKFYERTEHESVAGLGLTPENIAEKFEYETREMELQNKRDKARLEEIEQNSGEAARVTPRWYEARPAEVAEAVMEPHTADASGYEFARELREHPTFGAKFRGSKKSPIPIRTVMEFAREVRGHWAAMEVMPGMQDQYRMASAQENPGSPFGGEAKHTVGDVPVRFITEAWDATHRVNPFEGVIDTLDRALEVATGLVTRIEEGSLTAGMELHRRIEEAYPEFRELPEAVQIRFVKELREIAKNPRLGQPYFGEQAPDKPMEISVEGIRRFVIMRDPMKEHVRGLLIEDARLDGLSEVALDTHVEAVTRKWLETPEAQRFADWDGRLERGFTDRAVTEMTSRPVAEARRAGEAADTERVDRDRQEARPAERGRGETDRPKERPAAETPKRPATTGR